MNRFIKYLIDKLNLENSNLNIFLQSLKRNKRLLLLY